MSTRPADAMANRAHSRRRDERFTTSEEATVGIAGRELFCRVSDISAGGAMLEGELPLVAGVRIRLTFASFQDLAADVVHVGAGFVGVQFADAARHRDAIHAYIREQAMARKSAPGSRR